MDYSDDVLDFETALAAERGQTALFMHMSEDSFEVEGADDTDLELELDGHELANLLERVPPN